MIGALWILGVTVVTGIVLYLLDLRHRRRDTAGPAVLPVEDAPVSSEEIPDGNPEEAAEGEGSVCCGMHLVCEKDSLSPVSDDVEYYDDEELDRFIGRDGSDYTPEEEEEFRDVLMTLEGPDVAGWARSVTQRRLVLPPDVRDELLMLVNEQRELARGH